MLYVGLSHGTRKQRFKTVPKLYHVVRNDQNTIVIITFGKYVKRESYNLKYVLLVNNVVTFMLSWKLKDKKLTCHHLVRKQSSP